MPKNRLHRSASSPLTSLTERSVEMPLFLGPVTPGMNPILEDKDYRPAASPTGAANLSNTSSAHMLLKSYKKQSKSTGLPPNYVKAMVETDPQSILSGMKARIWKRGSRPNLDAFEKLFGHIRTNLFAVSEDEVSRPRRSIQQHVFYSRFALVSALEQLHNDLKNHALNQSELFIKFFQPVLVQRQNTPSTKFTSPLIDIETKAQNDSCENINTLFKKYAKCMEVIQALIKELIAISDDKTIRVHFNEVFLHYHEAYTSFANHEYHFANKDSEYECDSDCEDIPPLPDTLIEEKEVAEDHEYYANFNSHIQRAFATIRSLSEEKNIIPAKMDEIKINPLVSERTKFLCWIQIANNLSKISIEAPGCCASLFKGKRQQYQRKRILQSGCSLIASINTQATSEAIIENFNAEFTQKFTAKPSKNKTAVTPILH